MSSDEARPEITGGTTVTLLDQFKAFYWGAPLLWWAMAACIFITYLSSLPSPGDDADSDSFFNLPLIRGLVALLWIAIIVFSYWRLSREQKQVRYRVNTQQIEISDGTGAAVAIPWTIIKRCVETRSALLFRLRPGPALAAEARFCRCDRVARPCGAVPRLQAKLRRAE